MWNKFFENKSTLEKLSDNGTNLLFNGNPLSDGSTQVSTTGRPYALFDLRGATINVVKTTVHNDNTLYYSFPNLDSDRYRRLFIWTASGGHNTIDIPNGTLLDNDGLVYDISSNTLSTKNGTWGNISVSQNEYLLLYNNLGNIGGILSKYCVMGGDNLGKIIYEVPSELYSSTRGTTQGMFLMGSEMWLCAGTSTEDHTTYANITVVDKSNPSGSILYTHSQNIGHLNSVDYSASKDSLIVGDGSKLYTQPPTGWIFPNFSSQFHGNNNTLEFNTIDKITLDFTQFSDEYKGQLCWGYEGTDIVYLLTCDNSVIRKVLLGKGTNNLGEGVYVDGTNTPDRYNGSYKVLDKWISRTNDILGDMFFYKGHIYTGVKGEFCIRKVIPLTNGYFDSVYFPLINADGTNVATDIEGICYDDTYVYAFNGLSSGWRFPIGYLTYM